MILQHSTLKFSKFGAMTQSMTLGLLNTCSNTHKPSRAAAEEFQS
jgi:hypothetical protein